MTLKSVHQSGTHTHAGEREIYRQLQWRVAMATASLPLVSPSPSPSLSLSQHDPLSRGQSLIDCCRGNISLSCISNPVMPFATSLPASHFISGEWQHAGFPMHGALHSGTRRWRLTATGIVGDRMQMHRCTHPHPHKRQTHAKQAVTVDL